MKMSEEARKLRNASLREWRKKNPKKVQQHQINYWEKQAKLMQEEESGEELKV